MAIADQAALIVATKNLMGDSFDKVTDPGFVGAASQTELELPWPYPITVATKEFWMVERCRRHTIYVLMVESAHKFQYRLIHLEHRFKNYIQLIKNMDETFYKAMEDDPNGVFDDIGAAFSDFAYLITSGFIYDSLGRDASNFNSRVILP
jgi:hypothetical protein